MESYKILDFLIPIALINPNEAAMDIAFVKVEAVIVINSFIKVLFPSLIHV